MNLCLRNKIIVIFEVPVDCHWSGWTISPCSTTCGKGYREKIRTKIVAEKDGGVCNGEDVEEEYCNQNKCLGIYIFTVSTRFYLESI